MRLIMPAPSLACSCGRAETSAGRESQGVGGDKIDGQITRAVESADFKPFKTVYRLFRADTGEMRWLLEWGRLIPDSAGQPWRIVGAIEDITDRRRMELDQRANEERWRLALRGGRMVAW